MIRKPLIDWKDIKSSSIQNLIIASCALYKTIVDEYGQLEIVLIISQENWIRFWTIFLQEGDLFSFLVSNRSLQDFVRNFIYLQNVIHENGFKKLYLDQKDFESKNILQKNIFLMESILFIRKVENSLTICDDWREFKL